MTTNKALFYRPAPKGGIAAAFTVAAALHLSAVALASLHHQTATVPSPGFTQIVFFEPATPEPVAEPQEIQSPRAPGPEESQEFFDTETPPRRFSFSRRQPVAPIHSRKISATQNLQTAIGKPLALRAPRPEYPYEARSRHITGSGVATLAVDPATGFVRGATMTQSTGNSILDRSALSAFGRWQFAPGTASTVRIPITYTLTGAEL